MDKPLYILNLIGRRRSLAAALKDAFLAALDPTFDHSYIHVSVEAYNKNGILLWRFQDSFYNKDRYPLTKARYVFVKSGSDYGLYITSPADIATFTATGHSRWDKPCKIFDLSGLGVSYSDIYTLREGS